MGNRGNRSNKIKKVQTSIKPRELTPEEKMHKLMDNKIQNFYIGFEKIGANAFHLLNETIFYGLKQYLPAHLGGGRFFFHTTAFFELKDEYNGVLVEYGGDPKGNGYLPVSSASNSLSLKQFYKYGKKGGLRFEKMTYFQFIKRSDKFMKLIIRVNNIPSVNELIDKICKSSVWKKDDYNGLFHNCQDFVCKVIEKLDAVRPRFQYLRSFHNNAVASYPICIINKLEENENDSSKIVDSIPLIGPIEENIRLIGYCISNLK